METNNQNSAQQERKPFPFEDESRILDIRYDAVFKAVTIYSKKTSHKEHKEHKEKEGDKNE